MAIRSMVQEAVKECACGYELCEVYYFRHPHLRPGFAVADGRVLAGAQTLYPEAWSHLQTPEGQALCLTEAEWQGMSTATFATLADGTNVGWDGVGGVPYFVLDPASGSLRLPDLRGMYAEASGFDSLGVGDVHGDKIRNITGLITNTDADPMTSMSLCVNNGALYYDKEIMHTFGCLTSNDGGFSELGFDASRVVPTGNVNKPRAWGALACVYIGKPAA